MHRDWQAKIMNYKYTLEYIAVVVTVLLVMEVIKAVGPAGR